MKSAALVLLAVLGSAPGQTVPLPVSVAGAAIQQGEEPSIRTYGKYTCTLIFVQVAMPGYQYVVPEPGYAPAWQPGPFDRPLAFAAPASWQGRVSSTNLQTSDMSASPEVDKIYAAQALTASMSAVSVSAASTVQAWAAGNAGTTEIAAEPGIIANGRLFHSYRRELAEARLPGPPTREIYFCR